MTLMEKLLEMGYQREEMYHHCSDLYVYFTPLTVRAINEWLKEEGLSRRGLVSTFTDQVSGRLMFDVSFQYTPYWADKEI